MGENVNDVCETNSTKVKHFRGNVICVQFVSPCSFSFSLIQIYIGWKWDIIESHFRLSLIFSLSLDVRCDVPFSFWANYRNVWILEFWFERADYYYPNKIFLCHFECCFCIKNSLDIIHLFNVSFSSRTFSKSDFYRNSSIDRLCRFKLIWMYRC